MKNEKLVWKVVKMLYQRYKHWDELESYEYAAAYRAAHDMLLYALDGNEECLRQFDYYGEEKENDE